MQTLWDKTKMTLTNSVMEKLGVEVHYDQAIVQRFINALNQSEKDFVSKEEIKKAEQKIENIFLNNRIFKWNEKRKENDITFEYKTAIEVTKIILKLIKTYFSV